MEGYPALAEVMSTNDGLDIFRRFSALNALNLLYMQAEILDLELELQDNAAECKGPSGFCLWRRRRVAVEENARDSKAAEGIQ